MYPNNKFRPTRIDDYGRIKLRTDDIYNLCWLSTATTDINLQLDKIEEDDESVVYAIDL